MELVFRVKGLVFAPEAEWSAIERERPDVGVLAAYVAVLAAVPAVAEFLGDSLIGVTSATARHSPLVASFVGAAFDYAGSFVVVLLVAALANMLAPRFGAKPSYPDALKVVVYAFTPYWLVGVFLLVPGLRFLCVLGLCAVVPLWSGLVRVMHSPRDAALRYTATVAGGAVVLTMLAIVLSGLAIARLQAG